MPFKKGQSGNPAGKPKGTRNYETLTALERRAEFDKMAAKKFEEWINKCSAEFGLTQFLKLKNELELVLKNKPTDETQEKLNKAIKKLYG